VKIITTLGQSLILESAYGISKNGDFYYNLRILPEILKIS